MVRRTAQAAGPRNDRAVSVTGDIVTLLDAAYARKDKEAVDALWVMYFTVRLTGSEPEPAPRTSGTSLPPPAGAVPEPK
jgi:hypothetical protein